MNPNSVVRKAIVIGFGISFLLSGNSAFSDEAAREKLFQDRIGPLFLKHCIDCHSGTEPSAGFSLERLKSAKSITKSRKEVEKVIQQVQSKSMPPKDSEPLSEEDRVFLAEWLGATLNAVDCVKDPNPGKVTVRRLNRTEYRNTVRDLVGLDYTPARDFPGDDVGYGFDNIGDVLTLPPILMEKYLVAAEQIASKAIRLPPPNKKFEIALSGGQLKVEKGGNAKGSSAMLSSAGEATLSEQIPWAGDFQIKIRAAGDQAGNEPVRMGLLVDGKQQRVIEVKNDRKDPKDFEYTIRLRAGNRKIALSFLNDYYRAGQNGAPNEDRNLVIEHVSLIGEKAGKAVESEPLPDSHSRIIFVRPSDEVPANVATKKVVERLASRAFRRPATQDEVLRLSELASEVQKDGLSFEASIQVVLEAILVSPQFLFRFEDRLPPSKSSKFGELNDFDLATRLSYFLWSSMPDDELFRLALQGKLKQDDVLREQVIRMIRDRRSNQMVENFAGQWLQLRKLEDFKPDTQRFPQFNDELKSLIKRETFTFFAGVMREDRSVLDLIAADYTYLNEPLAKFYGVTGVKGDQFRQVSLAGTPRGGLLTQASILAVTSNPTRTSPVKRGKFILDSLLGTPPPPAPPGVPELKERGQLTGTLRQRMEQHREDPACAACHKAMDPLGFALENFDAIGRFRTKDEGSPIDASGELPDGTVVANAAELRRVLLEKNKQKFVRCLTEKMLTYALGRGLEYYDKCCVDRIAGQLEKDQYRFSTLVVGIVLSDPFRKIGEKEE